MLGCSAGVVVLDDDRGRIPEFEGQTAGRFEIDEIVVGEFLALELLGGCQTFRGTAGWNIKGCGLVRILTIAQFLLAPEGEMHAFGEQLFRFERDVPR